MAKFCVDKFATVCKTLTTGDTQETARAESARVESRLMDMTEREPIVKKKSGRRRRRQVSDIDIIISHCLRGIWEQYDADGNGELDREELRFMLNHTLPGFTESSSCNFDKLFDELDADGNGVIDKQELFILVKRSLLGL